MLTLTPGVDFDLDFVNARIRDDTVAKNNRKTKKWQLHKIDFYTTASTNSSTLFDDSHRWMFDPGGRA